MSEKKRRSESRAFMYRVYKIMCKMLEVEAICYGKMSKRDGVEVIYGITDEGLKKPLCADIGPRYASLALRKNARKDDIQLAIVKRVLKELEKRNVFRVSSHPWDSKYPAIEKGTCFEKLVVEEDLKWKRK